MDCCSSEYYLCGENEGDCDGNHECIGNLICGHQNCKSIYNSPEDFTIWSDIHDCCYDPTICDGNQDHTWDCCSTSFQSCEENQGDCDSDEDCIDGLICGDDNCINILSTDSFSLSHDCCFNPLNATTPMSTTVTSSESKLLIVIKE